MPHKVNCWEYMRCGYIPDHPAVDDKGSCPVVLEWRLDGVHGGRNAGRACWVVEDTFCFGQPFATFREKCRSCARCDFFKTVAREEGSRMSPVSSLLEFLEINIHLPAE